MQISSVFRKNNYSERKKILRVAFFFSQEYSVTAKKIEAELLKSKNDTDGRICCIYEQRAE